MDLVEQHCTTNSPMVNCGGKKPITLEKSEEKCSCEMSVSNRKHAVWMCEQFKHFGQSSSKTSVPIWSLEEKLRLCRFRDLSVTESEQASPLNSCLNMYKTQWCLKFSVKREYKIRFERGLTICANLHKGSRGIMSKNLCWATDVRYHWHPHTEVGLIFQELWRHFLEN